jgi:DNA-binding transcriptional MocR family regulator
MNGKVTFDGAPPPGTINFGVGQPSADLLPVDLIRAATEDYLACAQAVELNYGVREGDVRFLDSLSGFLADNYGAAVAPESLFLTAGNSHALDLVCTAFTEKGDTIIVEEPSYFLAFQVFRDHGLNIIGIPVDDDGMDLDTLESELERTDAAMLYTIPSFHNPCGHTMTLERRKRLVELSQKHDFLIVADEVYQVLNYFDEAPPAMGTMVDSDTVLSLGSFSKILAPGLRLGWIQTSPRLREELMSGGAVSSGGSFNHFTSHVVRHAIDMGLQQDHLEHLRKTYGKRVETMDAALKQHLGDRVSWRRPGGGYFFWLKLESSGHPHSSVESSGHPHSSVKSSGHPHSSVAVLSPALDTHTTRGADELVRIIDTQTLRRAAIENQTGFQPGVVFSSKGGLRNYFRLSFAHYSDADIREGIRRLAEVLPC